MKIKDNIINCHKQDEQNMRGQGIFWSRVCIISRGKEAS